MKLRSKIGLGFAAFIVLAAIAVRLVLGYDADCGPPPADYRGDDAMKAARYHCYGGPEILRIEEVQKPSPGAGEVLVRVHAAGVNPLDWHYLRGTPYLMRLLAGIGRPRDNRLGVDFAGTVEAVGTDVTRFEPGDDVFGGAAGAYAEYLLVREDGAIARKPQGVPFDQAAGVAIAGVTALQGLRDKGRIEAGDRVLINGASGGVGSFAVQIAKAYGADVTGVCSTRNLERVLALGADHVIDYTQQSYLEGNQSFDLILDMVGNHSLTDNLDVLEPDGVLVTVGDADIGDWIDPLLGALGSLIISPFVSQEIVGFIARLDPGDLQILASMMAEGRLQTLVDSHYTLQQLPEALAYSEDGHASGKLIVELD